MIGDALSAAHFVLMARVPLLGARDYSLCPSVGDQKEYTRERDTKKDGNN